LAYTRVAPVISDASKRVTHIILLAVLVLAYRRLVTTTNSSACDRAICFAPAIVAPVFPDASKRVTHIVIRASVRAYTRLHVAQLSGACDVVIGHARAIIAPVAPNTLEHFADPILHVVVRACIAVLRICTANAEHHLVVLNRQAERHDPQPHVDLLSRPAL